MEISSSLDHLGVGDRVAARRRGWRVLGLRHEGTVTLLGLQPMALDQVAARTLVHPFDVIVRARERGRVAWVSRRRALRALGTLAIALRPFDLPVSAGGAPVRLLPFQLEPLLALRAGIAARFLIADHVGLGKTIQAALIIRDLVSVDPRARVLVLTPAGLRDQWAAELDQRCRLDVRAVDADRLRQLVGSLPPDANPWHGAPITLASIDFVKQPEVRHGLRELTWDLLVIDEAHTLTTGTDRLEVASQLAARSARVVLLTATPHDGREHGYETLCRLGLLAGHEPMAIFRRSREAAGLTGARVTRRLAIAPAPAERRLTALLERYARRVWTEARAADRAGARLAMTVLFKRAASSPGSLLRSLERRRALIALASAAPWQAGLPGLDREAPTDDEEPSAVLAAPGCAPSRERVWLNLLVQAAATAARHERKAAALVRLVRRVREPLIVFTEYRDTLARLEPLLARVASVATLHGAMTAAARAAALRSFDAGAARVLLATDAASEGLNLQRGCRLVVHVELPWSPTRLEQRIGRVDRFGQTRRVHTLQLIAPGTVERYVETRLAERQARVRQALDADHGDDDAVAWLGAALDVAPAAAAAGVPAAARDPRAPSPTRWPALAGDAARTVAQLEALRRLSRALAGRPAPARRAISGGRDLRWPCLARIRPSPARPWLPRGMLFVYRVRLSSHDGAAIDHTLVPLHVPGLTVAAARRADGVLQPWLRAALEARVRAAVDARGQALGVQQARRADPIARRHQAIASRDRRAVSRLQLALFPELVPAASRPGEAAAVPVDPTDGRAALVGDFALVAALTVE